MAVSSMRRSSERNTVRKTNASPAVIAPASDARMDHLLAMAKRTFTVKGFAATTMDDVAGAAGMSKKTLYKLFDSKTELFRAMLSRSLPQARFAGVPLVGPPTAQLRTLLRRIADVAMAPDEIALHRLIVGERLASPGLGAMFSEVIMSAALDEVTEVLRRTTLNEKLRALPPPRVTEMLLGLVFGHDHFRLLADDGFHFNRRALNQRIDTGIALFCERETEEAAAT